LEITNCWVDLGKSDLHFFSLTTRLQTDRSSGLKRQYLAAPPPLLKRYGLVGTGFSPYINYPSGHSPTCRY
jgi:hypothetical protein